MKVFSERLKELRKNMNFSQLQLANLLDTTNSSVCDWERERSQPDLQTLAMLACLFDVTVDYLLGLEDETGTKVKPYFNR